MPTQNLQGMYISRCEWKPSLTWPKCAQQLNYVTIAVYLYVTWWTGALCMVAWDIWSIIHQTPRVEPKEKVVLINIKSQTNMHCLLCSPLWLVSAISEHTTYTDYTLNKVAHRKHHFTISCGIWNRTYNFLSVLWPTCYHTKGWSGEYYGGIFYCDKLRWRITVHNVTLHAD